MRRYSGRAAALGQAEARYQEAFALAQRLGDLELQGTFLIDLGIPAAGEESGPGSRTLRPGDAAAHSAGGRRCRWPRSAARLRGQNSNAGSSTPRRPGTPVPASWPWRWAIEAQLGTTAQHLGILYQDRAEREADSARRIGFGAPWHLSKRAWPSGSSLIKWALRSRSAQLGVVYPDHGRSRLCRRKFRRALEIFEELEHPEVWKVHISPRSRRPVATPRRRPVCGQAGRQADRAEATARKRSG